MTTEFTIVATDDGIEQAQLQAFSDLPNPNDLPIQKVWTGTMTMELINGPT